MFEIKYTSENGTAALGGGQAPLLRVRSITGIGLPSREYKNVAVSNGQHETSRRDEARVITIGGDLLGNGNDLENFERIAYADGILEFTFGQKKRRIHCKLYNMSDPTRIIPGKLISFAVQFVCDDPYFEDTDATIADIVSLTNTVIDTFTLPCVFTTSTNTKKLTVTGEKSVFPIIRIGCVEEGEESAVYGVSVANVTTGETLTLHHRMRMHETITVDLKERTITSSIDGNIINSLSDDSDMAKMYLLPGDNIITANSLTNAETNYIQVEYRSEYLAMEY